MANPWTDETIAQLRDLIDQGLTSGQIAKAMGEPFTRNSVIGKAARLQLHIGIGRVVDLTKGSRLKWGEKAQAKVIPVGFFGRSRHDSEAQSRKAAKSATLSKPVSLASVASSNVVAFRRALPPVIAPAPEWDGPDDADVAAVFSPASDPPGVALMDLQWRHCRWPLGDTKAVTTHFCGLDKARGSYCAAHAQLAYTGTDAERRNEYKRKQRALLVAAE